MNTSRLTRQITIAALLSAVGILVPMFMPRLPILTMTFTLASHVAVLIAMFLSPGIAIAVAIGTTLGFALSAPPDVVLRAASHMIFVTLGAFYIKMRPTVLGDTWRMRLFSLIIGIIHATAEVVVVTFFWFAGTYATKGAAAENFALWVLLLVGVGTLIHSMVDFEIAYWITKAFRGPAHLRIMLFGQEESANKKDRLKTAILILVTALLLAGCVLLLWPKKTGPEETPAPIDSPAPTVGAIESPGRDTIRPSEPPATATPDNEDNIIIDKEEKAMATLLYQGHGSLRIITAEGKVIYIDPYAGEGYDLPADLILVTHQHSDHNNLKLIQTRNPDCEVITEKEALQNGEHQGFDLGYVKIEAVEANNKNHSPKSCVGYILT
ncbi:MAG: MBL fold metallo-hydrolase, partial [Clostridiales bacterium]|nr:MBL fold metallo-hydrolase [Clostridiales bacterium]